MAENILEYEQWDLRRIPIPPDVERDIVTPHSHESMRVRSDSIYGDQPVNRPLWLIWVRERVGRGVPAEGILYYPQLDSVADCEESARSHYRMAVSGRTGVVVSVERIPANHRFASSLGEWQHETGVQVYKARLAARDNTGG